MAQSASLRRRPECGQVDVGRQVATPWFAEEVGGGSVTLIREGGAGHAARGVAQGGAVSTVIEHENHPLGEVVTELAGPVDCGGREFGELPLHEWRPGGDELGEPLGNRWVRRPLNPAEGICYRINPHAALVEAVRGAGAADHDMEGEGVGELIGDHDPCSGRGLCGHER